MHSKKSTVQIISLMKKNPVNCSVQRKSSQIIKFLFIKGSFFSFKKSDAINLEIVKLDRSNSKFSGEIKENKIICARALEKKLSKFWSSAWVSKQEFKIFCLNRE